MAGFTDFPDFEAAVGQALRSASISGLGTRVYSSVPANPTFPLVLVRRYGGVPTVRRYLDAARIQVDVWGTSKSEARDIASACRTVVMSMEGTTVTAGTDTAWISGVDDTTGLTWLPDPDTGRDCYLFVVTIHGRSTSGSATPSSSGYGSGGYGV